MNHSPAASDLSLVPEAQWEEARRCMSVIQPLANNPARGQEEIDNAVRELGFSRAQVYILLRRYLADPRLTSLLPRRRGPDRGFSKLTIEVEKLVDETIDAVYLAQQRPRVSDLVMEIRRRCRAVGLMPRVCGRGREGKLYRGAKAARRLAIALRPWLVRWKPHGRYH